MVNNTDSAPSPYPPRGSCILWQRGRSNNSRRGSSQPGASVSRGRCPHCCGRSLARERQRLGRAFRVVLQTHDSRHESICGSPERPTRAHPP
jgi:hypothetical protein